MKSITRFLRFVIVAVLTVAAIAAFAAARYEVTSTVILQKDDKRSAQDEATNIAMGNIRRQCQGSIDKATVDATIYCDDLRPAQCTVKIRAICVED